ncbi:protein amnionless-like isoform X2 [Dreissena polymorpha]|uniref:Protein amnionless n=1 Tax=Dreissena polymorpha TaxID=45954 RepID=A0A9D4KXC5_DREPO|nr:protein amnionless-like isoform X2 [Dreissena polymorpha]XP_052273182.1 protein amnionless-like isoform X2 [Dreissena polymorpha]KAH3846701.1 hypothetical protein DPMN_089003 [Dreissena polymorpha]
MEMNKLVVVFFLFVVPVEGLFIRWLRNTDLNNPHNWDRGNLPCGNDRMIIPDDSPVVFMQINTTVQELVLPATGELVFGSFFGLAFTNEPDHSAACLDSGSDITFNASHPADWFDPDNWCLTDTETGPCKDMALLDTERIPCSTGDVVFPTGSSYYVDLGRNKDIQVNTLKVSGKAYSTNTFRDYLRTENGRNIFPPPATGAQSSVTMNRRKCTDQTGCACGNDQGQIFETVCTVTKLRCPRPLCAATIKPVGHCCNVCGGMLTLTYGTGFNLDTFNNSIQRNFVENEKYPHIKYILSKRSDGKIQMVLWDDNKGVMSSQLAQDILADIKQDITTGGMRYAIMEATLQSTATGGSGAVQPGSHSAHTGAETELGRGSVAGVTIGCIAGVLVVCLAAFLLYRRTSWSCVDTGRFSRSIFNKFNRFDASEARSPQVTIPTPDAFAWGSLDSGVSSAHSSRLSQGFDNPMFGEATFDTQNPVPMEMEVRSVMSEEQPKTDFGFDNPLYDSVHQDSLFSDPSVVVEPQPLPVVTLEAAGCQETTTDA